MIKYLYKRFGKNAVQGSLWLGISTICFLFVALSVVEHAEGALGAEFFMLMGLMQFYIITLHIKLHMMMDMLDAQMDLIEATLDVAKTSNDTKALTPKHIQKIASLASDLLFKKVSERIKDTAHGLRESMEGDGNSTISERAMAAVNHMNERLDGKLKDISGDSKDNDLPDLTKWVMKDD